MDDNKEPGIKPLTVSELTAALKHVMETTFPYLWVQGEVSNCKAAGSGHVYFTLKDEGAQLATVLWRSTAQRLRFQLKDGLKILVAGPIQLYEARGQYQLIAERVEPQGIGALELAFRQLRQTLEAEGLFDAARKRALPAFPRRIALITSPTGAAVRDMLQIIVRRWPRVRIVVIPVPVQGEGAAAQIAAALRRVHTLPEVDVVLCGRGGGSLEDLWAFNEEVVARAIFDCRLPVISAVGHEVDLTIADLVADRRALTPSEGAELVVPVEAEIRIALERLRQRLTTALRHRAQHAHNQIDLLSQRTCFSRPFDLIREREELIDEMEERLGRSMRQKLQQARQDLATVTASLNALSPLAVLQRGYSLTKRLDDGSLIREPNQLRTGDQISTLFATGEVVSQVLHVDADE